MAVLYRGSPDSLFESWHSFTTPYRQAIARRPVSFAVNPQKVSYMFAFLNEDGSIKVWAVRANEDLRGVDLAKEFRVFDRIGDHSNEPLTSTCRFIVLPALLKSST